MKSKLLLSYNSKEKDISFALNNFKKLSKNRYVDEFIFCTLTPQSNAKKCWEAVEKINKLKKINRKSLISILKSRTRFHNNKSLYIIYNLKNWNKIRSNLNNKSIIELRNFIAENVKGYGLKEASHFLRNIGKSDNQIAILDRHILRNLNALNVIKDEKIKNNKHYFELEQKFLNFSREINIPIDNLDLFFWSQETGEIFK